MLESLIKISSSEVRRLNAPRFAASPFDRRRGRASRRLQRQIFAKCCFDQIVALVLLVPCVPLVGLLWLLVKATSRGPGFFFQRRVGLNGREFRICKLRTMAVNCEQKTGAVWAQPNDPRVTQVGRFLRAAHLDELPQLYNVLRGEMSLVGPRPERPEIIKRLLPEIPRYPDRLQVRPGVTGWAQVSAKADLTLDDVRIKLRYDLQYMEAMSLWLDVRILACTALKV
jgi:lipopolysaccharide/colanic/teichoic acid biosynthesis glycosyltransferase